MRHDMSPAILLLVLIGAVLIVPIADAAESGGPWPEP
jgi:hypothetical protein